ncbi:ROK family protein [Dactylosporangium sp. NPDC051541]|uniref:ROK family transcriptional regulator n=1 Tax=Dactylosporangium sp. NPDC051541 TaxID=3363977 RepID=UPI0037B597E2
MQVERASHRGVRLHNRSALLTRLFLEGPLTRQDLSRRTGLSQPAVSNVVNDLIDDGLVDEAGALESEGGRPSTMLRVAPSYGAVAGVDVGETRIRVELFDLGRRRLAEADLPLEPGASPPAVADRILTGLRAVATGHHVLGAGIGVAGIVQDSPDGALVHAQTLGWEAVPLESLLRQGTDIPLHLDNGAKTLGQAEMWFGAGRGRRHAVFALVGSGVGAAVVTNGATYRGTSSSAGEWGHTTLIYNGRPCRCGASGCLEAYVGAAAILDRYDCRRLGDVQPSDGGSGDVRLDDGGLGGGGLGGGGLGDVRLGGGGLGDVRLGDGGLGGGGLGDGGLGGGGLGDGRSGECWHGDEEARLAALVAAAAAGEPAARAVLDETADYLGAGVADLINLFNPELVVLGGWAGVALAGLLPRVRASAARHALRQPFAQARIEPGRLGLDAVALGAATLPIARLLTNGGRPTP